MTVAYRRSPEDIVDLFRQRQASLHPIRATALEVRNVANGDVDAMALPMPELSDGGGEKLAVANLLVQGLNGDAQRIASTFYDIMSPALQRGQEKSERYAKVRRRAALGWLDMNRVQLKMGRRARHLLAYSSSPVMLRPDKKRRIPRWQVRDPLGCLPAPTADFEDVEPPDCIFPLQRSLAWLLQEYPERAALLHVGKKAGLDDMFDVLEYVDEEQITLLVIGRDPSAGAMSTGWNAGTYSGVGKTVVGQVSGEPGGYGSSQVVVLEQLENRARRCTAIVPWRITLDRPTGQYDSMLGKFYWQARLSALELIAIERGIFPSEWVVFPPDSDGSIIVEANGRKGIIGEIRGGEYHVQNVNPGYKTTEGLDRLERAQRQDGGIPAEYGDESNTNIRTDRRGMSVLGAAIDFKHQEVQKLFEASAESELVCAAAVDQGYFGDEKKSYFVNWRGATGPVDYVPNKHFEPGFVLKAKYALAGADADNLTIRNSQKIGAKTMSRRTSMEQDPDVPDVEIELERIESEEIRMAVLAAYQAQAQAGTLPLVQALRVGELREQGVELYLAIRQSDDEARALQSTPVAPGDAAARPGLAMPGMGAEAPSAAAGAPPSLQDLLGKLNVRGRGGSPAASSAAASDAAPPPLPLPVAR